MKIFACALLLSACAADDSHGSGVVGSPADVTTQPGDYAGYRVVMPCDGAGIDVGVTGTGHVALTSNKDISAAGQDLHTQFADLASVWGGGGYGLACDGGVGTQVALNNWHDVDVVIARTGAWLLEHDYKLQVGIAVDGIPVPVNGH
jgi:hypothetical protein